MTSCENADVAKSATPGASFNTLRPRWNEQHFVDDIFKCIFFNENVWISIKISLKFVPKGPINNIPALVQIMAWRRSGDKPLSEPMMVSLPTHICVTRPQRVKTIRSISSSFQMLRVFVYKFEFISGDQIHNRLCNICIWGLCVLSSHISLLMLLRILVFYRITIIKSEMWFINHCLKVRSWNNILCYMFYSVLTIIVYYIVVLFMYFCHLGLFCDIWFVRHRALPKGSMSCNLPI